jgi:hypothetical protein
LPRISTGKLQVSAICQESAQANSGYSKFSGVFAKFGEIFEMRRYPAVLGVDYVTFATDTTFPFPKGPEVG